jgi:hypothetical protein
MSKAQIFTLCLLLVAICYANSLSNPFIQDDRVIIQGNDDIRHIEPLRLLRQPYSSDPRFGGAYRPLTMFSFALDYALWH